MTDGYPYDTSIVPIDYTRIIYRIKDNVFLDFEDEYLAPNLSQEQIYIDYEPVEISESLTEIKLDRFQRCILWLLALVRQLSNFIFTIIFKVSGGLGVLTVVAVGLSTLIQKPDFLDCLSHMQYISDSRYNRRGNCISLSQMQDKIKAIIAGK